ncbi:hypothetical protein B1A99_09740 [Cohnella sp. CIP 111063]|jgi:Cytochrome b subunit of the bc complex|uniref:hypothetical protein n=1 Tax=unclassified Cohnella TaxID=2636738 RepID=UPI000B8C0E6F|nr:MULTISPECIES: hypothetical protein [unclassified Cohnella]OXS59814.1 hypothetical protein B1A99_09740 [Cohnella sp. CIP 111063]PRX72606.1 hypothetical protein B0G52_105159 [Cohnella sp. SGD-V74]
MRVRYVIEALLFSLVVIGGWVAWAVVSGMMLTRSYVPDIVESYSSVEHLQSEVSFGVVYNVHWSILAGGFIALAALYYFARAWLSNRLSARKS